MDFGCLLIGGAVGLLARFGHPEMVEYVYGHLEGWVLLFGSVLLANYLAGSYRLQYTFSRFNLVVTWLFTLFFALLIVSITSYTWLQTMLGRGVLLISIAVYSLLSLSLKILVYHRLFRGKAFICRTAIIGRGDLARELRETVENRYVLPRHEVVAYVDPYWGGNETPGSIDGIRIIPASAGKLADVLHDLDVNLIILAFPDRDQLSPLYSQLRKLRFGGVEVLSPLNIAEIYSGRTPLKLITEEHLMQGMMESQVPVVQRTKKILDKIMAFVGCILCLPLAAIIMVLVKLESPADPVFYIQDRVGRFGKIFRIYKFRTMKHGCEADTGAVWATADDSRVTSVGRFLRRFRLDEIPQFWNVLKGDMSIVGPRPERPELVKELIEKIPFYSERENVMPGLTGWAQIRYRYGSTIQDTARKLEYDLFYMKHLTLSLDLQIILRTLRTVFFGDEQEPRPNP